MTNYFTKENISTFFNRLSLFFNSLFPGIVILEIFFRIGYFSIRPDSYIALFLYIFWAGIFSLPFSLYPYSITSILSNLLTELNKKFPITATTGDLLKIKEELKEAALVTNHSIRLAFNILRLCLIYVMNKFLIFFDIPNDSILHISTEIIHLIICSVIIALLTLPLAKLFSILYLKYTLNVIEKRICDRK